MHGRTNDLAYRVALHRIPRLDPVRFQLLKTAFGSLEGAWRADHGALCAAGLDATTAQVAVRERAAIDPLAELERLARAGVQALVPGDGRYPARLEEIASAPPVLYVRGSWGPEDNSSVAIVGTRRATAYGRQAAGEFARELAANRVTVVSGLARGIDTVARRSTPAAARRPSSRTASTPFTRPRTPGSPTKSPSAARCSRTTRSARSRAPSTPHGAIALCCMFRSGRSPSRATTPAAR